MRVGLAGWVAVVVVVASFAAVGAHASQTQVHNVEGTSALLDGDFDGASVSGRLPRYSGCSRQRTLSDVSVSSSSADASEPVEAFSSASTFHASSSG